MKKRRSVCPVACTLDLIGDRWTLLVIRDLFCGKVTFKEFAQSPEGIATNILTDRLNRLLGEGLIEHHELADAPGRFGYRLTPRGESLEPVLLAVTEWGLAHVRGTEVRVGR